MPAAARLFWCPCTAGWGSFAPWGRLPRRHTEAEQPKHMLGNKGADDGHRGTDFRDLRYQRRMAKPRARGTRPKRISSQRPTRPAAFSKPALAIQPSQATAMAQMAAPTTLRTGNRSHGYPELARTNGATLRRPQTKRKPRTKTSPHRATTAPTWSARACQWGRRAIMRAPRRLPKKTRIDLPKGFRRMPQARPAGISAAPCGQARRP